MFFSLAEIWLKQNSLPVCRSVSNHLIFIKKPNENKFFSVPEQFKDERKSYWEDLHFAEVLLLMGGGTRLRLVAVSCESH